MQHSAIQCDTVQHNRRSVTAHLSPPVYDRVLQVAADNGLSVSEFVYRTLAKAIGVKIGLSGRKAGRSPRIEPDLKKTA